MSSERPTSPPAVESHAEGRFGVPRRNLAPLYAGGLIVLILLVFAMNFGNQQKPKPLPAPPPTAGSASDLSGLLEEEAARRQRSTVTPRRVPPPVAPVPRGLSNEPTFPPLSLPPDSATAPAPAGVYDPRWPGYLAQQPRAPLPLPPSAPSQLSALDSLGHTPAGAGPNEARPALRYRTGTPAPERGLPVVPGIPGDPGDPANPASTALAVLAAELPLLTQSSQPSQPLQPLALSGDPTLRRSGETPSSRYATFLKAVGNERPEALELGRDLAAARTPFLLLQGTQIPAVLETGISSELPGQASGYVRKDIYDTLTGRYLLIPQGSRLLGSYNSDIVWGASRLLLVWNRLILPDGTSYSIVAPSADLAGSAGLPGRVNNHWGKTLGSALMLSAISAGLQISQNPATTSLNRTPSASEAAGAAVGQELGQVSGNVIRKNLDIPPTLSLRPGLAFSVVLTRDVALPHPYLRRTR
ncbi:MAG TPA: TrbI/VirB10 family protein [Thermoanaerobaculia bacterium]|jgi:type IV secretion system protein VirB10|nr:TrbI/VirB10 family protein [Thermoanaerobaculia bacterium]